MTRGWWWWLRIERPRGPAPSRHIPRWLAWPPALPAHSSSCPLGCRAHPPTTGLPAANPAGCSPEQTLPVFHCGMPLRCSCGLMDEAPPSPGGDCGFEPYLETLQNYVWGTRRCWMFGRGRPPCPQSVLSVRCGRLRRARAKEIRDVRPKPPDAPTPWRCAKGKKLQGAGASPALRETWLHNNFAIRAHKRAINIWPYGLMDKALVLGTKDSRFES